MRKKGEKRAVVDNQLNRKTMKELCNIIYIYLVSQVDLVTSDGLVNVKPGESPIVVNAYDFDLTPAVNDSKASSLKSYAETIYIDKLQSSDAAKLKIKRSVILQFKLNNDQNVVIGSLNYPAKVTLTQSVNVDMLKIEHKQPTYL